MPARSLKRHRNVLIGILIFDWAVFLQLSAAYNVSRVNFTVTQYQRSHPEKKTLQWHHNKRDGVSNHKRLDRFLKAQMALSGRFLSKMASFAENIHI